MMRKLGLIAAVLVALVGGVAYAVDSGAADGPRPAMPLIYEAYTERAHAQISADSLRDRGAEGGGGLCRWADHADRVAGEPAA